MSFLAHPNLIKFALWTGILVIGLTILLILQILFMRARLIKQQRRNKRFLSVWRPLLTDSLVGIDPNSLLTIDKKDLFTFLRLWNHLQESLQGESKERLNQVARCASIDSSARQMLKESNIRKRLMAIVTLGHLKEKSVWQELCDIAASDNPFLSLVAARAMIRIDAKEAISSLVPLISTRSDWAPSKVAMILKEAGTEVISKPLSDAALQVKPKDAARLIRYLEITGCEQALPTVRQLLKTSQDSELISACLRMLKDPQDLSLVRNYLSHAEWPVRLQVAAALGRMGTKEDVERLISLLSDKEWWVRYRAAQALIGLPFVSLLEVKQIKEKQTDRYAKDILDQVITEKEKNDNI